MAIKIIIYLIFLVVFVNSFEFKHNVEENIELVEELRNTLELKANETDDIDLKDWLNRSSDGILVNWILNSKKDLKKAETDIIEYVEWRIETDVDHIKDWTLYEDDERKFPWAVTGHDNDGDSILYFPIGSWPLKEFFANQAESNILFQHFLRGCEFAMSTPDPKTGKKPENFVFLIDFEGFDLTTEMVNQKVLDMAVAIANEIMTRFPLNVKRAIIVRDPPIFYTIWNIVKSFLSRRALLRVEFLGDDKKALLSHLPAETIPPPLAISAQIDYFNHKII